MIVQHRSLRAFCVLFLVAGLLLSSFSPALSSSWTVGKFVDFAAPQDIYPDVVSSPSGDFYLAYHSSNTEMRILKWTGSSWSTLHILTPSMSGINVTSFPNLVWLVVQAENDIHLAFYGDKLLAPGAYVSSERGVHYGHYNGTAWTFDTVDVYSDPNGWKNVPYFNMTVDAAGHPHMAIATSDANNPRASGLIYAVKNGAWSKTNVFSPISGGSEYVQYPTITTDAAGHAYIAYMDSSSAPHKLVLYSNATGAWARTELVNEPSGRTLAPYDLRADAAGKLHFTYIEGQTPMKSYYGTNASGSWVFDQVPGATGDDDVPRLSINDNGVKLISYLTYEAGGTRRVKVAFQRPGGNWQVEQPDGAADIDFYMASAINNANQAMVINERNAGAWYATATLTLTEISSVTVPANGTYGVGQALNFSVTYNEPVTVSGSPTLPVTLNSGPVQAAYLSGSGTSTLNFRYTTASGNLDTDGIALGAALALNGGGIKNGSGSDVSLALANVPVTSGIRVDAVAPAAPVLLTPANGSRTNDNTPTLTGTAEPNGSVTIYLDGVSAGTVTANASGGWSWTAAALADGAHVAYATAADAVGNTSTASNTNTFTVDTTPPAAPVLINPANGSLTNDNTPTFSGTAEAGSTVTVYVDGAVVGTTTADSAGNWTFTPVVARMDGPHTARATATDSTGNTSPASNTHTFTVDTTPPAAPVLASPVNNSRTGDNTPTISGTAEANSTVTISVDGGAVGITTADAAGNWQYTLAAALADGVHSARAAATDAAGNTSVYSNTNTFMVDTQPPAAPRINSPWDNSITNDSTPTLSGSAEAGSTVTIIVDGAVAGTVGPFGIDSWDLLVTDPLPDGPHTVTAFAVDPVGNAGPLSAATLFTVDTSAPAAPVVLTPASGSLTNNSTPTVSGTAEAGSRVAVWLDGAKVGTVTANASGAWIYSPAVLADGQHTVYATATDAAGNTGPASSTNTFTVDTTAPAAPLIAAPADGMFTSDTTPTFSGTAEAGSTITITLDGSPAGTTGVDLAGSWSWTPATPLADGLHTARVTATDLAGNTGPFSNPRAFTVDTLPPAAPVINTPVSGSFTNDSTPTFSGTAEANSTVTIALDGSPAGTAAANGAGAWSWTAGAALADGAYTARAAAADQAGNTGAVSAAVTFTIDTQPPTASLSTTAPALTNTALIPVVVTFSEPVSGLAQGSISADNATVSDLAGSGASYTFNLTAAGQGQVRVRILALAAQDAAGNSNPLSADLIVTYDSMAPGLVSITRADASPTNAAAVHFTVRFSETVSGLDRSDFALAANGLSGSAIQSLAGSGSTYIVTVATGSGSGTLRLDLSAGAGIVDAANNALVTSGAGWQVGDYTGGEVYTVDHTPPAAHLLTQDPLPRAGSGADSLPYSLTIRFSDDQGIDPSQFADGNIRLVGASFDSAARWVKTVEVTAGKVYEVTYQIDAPFDGWGSLPYDRYDVVLQANQVHDLNGSDMDQQVLGSVAKEEIIYYFPVIGR